MRFRNVAIFLILFFFTTVCFARPDGLREYRLVRVIDGDTIVVSRVKGEEIHVRLLGIDCLETRRTERLKKQAEELGLEVEEAYRLGEEAAVTVEQTLRDSPIFLEWEPKFNDKYQRKLGYVWAGSELLNLRLLETGQAKLYEGSKRSYRYEERFRAAQAQAKKDLIGIWADRSRGLDEAPVSARKPKSLPSEFPWRLVFVAAGLTLVVAGWRMK